MTLTISKLEEITEVARSFVDMIGDSRVFAFRGEMGVGKTTLIREICRQLGVNVDDAASPTFSIINEYSGDFPIYHFDFYRVENEIEGAETGAEDYFESGALCFIEWPEKIEGLLPSGVVNVRIEEDYTDGTRTVTIDK